MQEIPVGRPRPERLTRKEAVKAAAAAAASADADGGAEGPAGEGQAAAAGGAALEEPEQVRGCWPTWLAAVWLGLTRSPCSRRHTPASRLGPSQPASALAAACAWLQSAPSPFQQWHSLQPCHQRVGVVLWRHMFIPPAWAVCSQVDSYKFAEPKDIIPELKKDFWDGLASAKWSERKVWGVSCTSTIQQWSAVPVV